MTSTSDPQTMAERLREVARRFADGPCEVEGLRRLSGGASQETWRFTLNQGGTRSDHVLRRASPENAERPNVLQAGLRAEAALLALAAANGVPVPRVRAVLEETDGLSEGFIMPFIAGETLGGRIVREPGLAAARRVLAHQCGAAMAAIHRIPVAALPALRIGSAAREIEACQASYHEAGQARPVFDLAIRWLQRHLPESPPGTDPLQKVLVHGDFRNGNLMVDDAGLRAVLDWELAHVGDPMEDLGWICVNSWRFGGEGPVGGFGSREDLYAGYASGGGVVDEARVRFWEVLGVLKWGIVCETLSRPHAPGAALAVERAVIGRRSSETEFDLLQLLAPRGGPS